MASKKGAVRWYRKRAHWDAIKDRTVVVSERQVGAVQTVMDEYYGRHVIEASPCSTDGLLEYWEILGRVVDPSTLPEDSDTSYRSHIDAVVAELIGPAIKAQLREFLPAELGVKSIGRIYFTQ